MSKRQKILLVLLLVFLAAQAIRPKKNDGSSNGPKDITTVVAVPDSVQALLKKSCYDCHSNHSDYPWYDRVAPVSWWITNHINEGKRGLNFTEFADYTSKRKAKKLDGIAKTVQKGEMPLNSYLWMHGDAKLSEAQKKTIVDWANAAKQTIPDSTASH